MLHQQRQHKKARTWYTQALSSQQCADKNLNRSKIEFQIACTWYQDQQFTKASQALKRALECSPAYPSAHNLAALIMIEHGGDISA